MLGLCSPSTFESFLVLSVQPSPNTSSPLLDESSQNKNWDVHREGGAMVFFCLFMLYFVVVITVVFLISFLVCGVLGLDPLESYPNLAAFFTRYLKPGARPLADIPIVRKNLPSTE